MHAFTDHEDNVAEMMADILRAHAHGTAEHRSGASLAICETDTVAPASLTMALNITSKATPNTPITVATPIGEITLTDYTHRTDPLSFVTFEAWQNNGTQIPVVLGNNSASGRLGAESVPHVRVILTNVTIADDPVLRISATATAFGTGDEPCTLTCTQSYLGKSQTITLQKNGVSEPLYLVAEFHPKETTGSATIVLCPGGWAPELFAADDDVQIVIDKITAGQ